MTAKMQLGFMPEDLTEPYRHYQGLAQAAEATGFASFWLPDHLIIRFPNQAERGTWEAYTFLSALAAVTNTITLGPLVACTSFRNPALLAKMADSLDEISGGRSILGLGAGWHEPEYNAFGYPFDHLASRFEEALKIIVPLLHEGQVDFTGTYYQAHHAKLLPRGPSPKGPPIWIGAKRPRMLRLVAQYADAWNTVWHSDPAKVVENYQHLKDACAEVGRDPATIALTAGTEVHVLTPGETSDPDPKNRAITGTAEVVAEKLRGFAGVGVTHLVVILTPSTVEHIERFGRVIELLG